MTGPSFRRATPGDADAIHALLCDLARQDGAQMRGSAAALRRYGFGAHSLFQAVLAEEAGTVTGLVLFFPEYSTLRGCPGVFVQDLYVTAPARGQGLGRKLLAQAMEAARAWDAAYLALMVDRSNARARVFYDRCGFVDRGNYDALVLDGPGLAALGGA
ncbi:MAG: GNAT family N-acetyltransferase [Rhodobacter sp.]|nr:GNAT family N-acetyltransferase [Rhodobacter sp.]